MKLRKACGLDGIPNECLRYLPRRPLVHLTHLFNHCLRLSHFPKPWKEAKFPQNLSPISLLSITDKLFDEVILKMVRRNIEEKCLLNASHFGFRARHSTTLQCMRLTDHVTLNFNNNMSTSDATPQAPGAYLGPFADDICVYATGRKEGYVLRKLQRGQGAIEAWCERLIIKINEDTSEAIYFSHRLGPLRLILH
jgi:hypothetical protein